MQLSSSVGDLQAYHLARLLHLVPLLHRVYAENCFIVPLFFQCVSPAAKRQAMFILLCLSRVFGSNTAPEVCTHILSFISFPELTMSSTLSSVPTHVEARTTSDNSTTDNVNSINSERLAEPTNRKRLRDAEVEVLVSDSTDDQPISTSADANERSVDGGVVNRSNEAEFSAAEGGEKLAEEKLFFVRPPATTSKTTTTQLFVRMNSDYQLNEETMNTYFGRYGQVSCVLFREKQITDASRPGGTGYLQDFILTVDSMHNALQAVRNAYYRELSFIALHDPTHNVYKLSDIDNVLCLVDVEVVEESPPDSSTGVTDVAVSHAQSFVPDIVVDHLPYWLTVDQLRASFSQYGTVVDVRIAVDDRSGTFTGAALLRMSSVEEAIVASEELNGAVMWDHLLVSGVLDTHLNVVSLRNGTMIRMCDEVDVEGYNLNENNRQWV
ncbi:putative RNA recognition motif (a k a RRM RBD or RNP domain) [Trypanosoma vivax]|nr:putative RNA recognition motif (a k a RRM RBD or RNP domain) [Trypanosoma vivax]